MFADVALPHILYLVEEQREKRDDLLFRDPFGYGEIEVVLFGERIVRKSVKEAFAPSFMLNPRSASCHECAHEEIEQIVFTFLTHRNQGIEYEFDIASVLHIDVRRPRPFRTTDREIERGAFSFLPLPIE